MLKKIAIFLTVFVFTVVVCSPVSAAGEETDGIVEYIEDEVSLAPEVPDDLPSPQNQTIDDLIRRLEEADGVIPADFSWEDMCTFLEEADQDTVSRIMDRIVENAVPVSVENNSVAASGEDERDVPVRADTYLSYDCRTGEKKELPFDTSFSSEEVLESAGGGN